MSDTTSIEILKRVRRLETRVTSFMRYHGFFPGKDLDVERVERVLIDHARGEVHVTSPDVPIGNILDAVITEGMDGADLYVAGVKAGRIDSRRTT